MKKTFKLTLLSMIVAFFAIATIVSCKKSLNGDDVSLEKQRVSRKSSTLSSSDPIVSPGDYQNATLIEQKMISQTQAAFDALASYEGTPDAEAFASATFVFDSDPQSAAGELEFGPEGPVSENQKACSACGVVSAYGCIGAIRKYMDANRLTTIKLTITRKAGGCIDIKYNKDIIIKDPKPILDLN